MSTTPTHGTVILVENTDGWTRDGGDVYTPACTCGVIPGAHYRTRAQAEQRAWHDLPRRCRNGGTS